jgi:hypothetical protein
MKPVPSMDSEKAQKQLKLAGRDTVVAVKDDSVAERAAPPLVDLTQGLPDAVLTKVLQFVGTGSFRYVAGTSVRFWKLYGKGDCITGVKAIVESVACASLFCSEAGSLLFYCKPFPHNFSTALVVVRDNAASYGRLSVLRWARAKGCPWDAPVCELAAKGGHLKVLQWLRAEGCPWDMWTIHEAAGGGHLEVLQWLRAEGCPWDVRVALGMCGLPLG